MEVLQATAAAVWLCPVCGHGSSDPRDEGAHLDAHRQLRAFFEDWDAGAAPEQSGPVVPARRRSSLYAVCALAVLMVWSLTVFSHVNRAKDGSHATPPMAAPSAVAPSGGQPSPAPTSTTPPAVTSPRTAPAPGAASGGTVSTARPAVAVTPAAPTAGGAPSEPANGASAAPATSVPPAAGPTVSALPPPEHVLSVCLLGICLSVL